MKNYVSAFISAVGMPVALMAGAAQGEARSSRSPDTFPQTGTRISAPYGALAFCRMLGAEQTQRYKNRQLDISAFPLRKECEPLPKGAPLSFSIDQSFTEGRANLYALGIVNQYVNNIPSLTDQDNHGVSEYWDYPNHAADCEDYVLLKRYILTYLGEYLRAVQKPDVKRLEHIADLVERGMDANYMQDLVLKLQNTGADLAVLARNTITAGALRIAVVTDENGEGHAILIGKTHQNRDIALDNKRDTLFWSNLPYKAGSISAGHDLQIWYAAP